MRTKYRFIEFLPGDFPENDEHQGYVCFNRKANFPIGNVRWYAAWRQYVYYPAVDTVYSAGCLQDIAEFVRAVNIESGEGIARCGG